MVKGTIKRVFTMHVLRKNFSHVSYFLVMFYYLKTSKKIMVIELLIIHNVYIFRANCCLSLKKTIFLFSNLYKS